MTDLTAQVMDPSLTPFERLCKLMEILRSPDGCGWDRAQTHQSLVPYLIEETYEVVEAVEANDSAGLKEELGDLLLQVVFHAQMADERGAFAVNEVIDTIVEKLIQRHPHVFGERKNLEPQQVRDQWEKIKTESGEKASVLGGLPRSMPALTSAFRIGEKAGGVGFDWAKSADALAKVKEEVGELEVELADNRTGRKERIEDEIGDLLFAVASVARLEKIDPERSLKLALEKFRVRFEAMEAEIKTDRGSFDDYQLEEMEAIWQKLKGGAR